MLVVTVAEEKRVCLGLRSSPSALPRVQFRADLLQRRREERETRELEQQREEEEKQNRLEALRNQVDHYLSL